MFFGVDHRVCHSALHSCAPNHSLRLTIREPGLRHALADRDAAIALAREVSGAKPDDPRSAYIYDEVIKYKAIDPAMPIPMDKLAWMKDLLTRTGTLTKPLDLASVTDGGPRAKALALVGK